MACPLNDELEMILYMYPELQLEDNGSFLSGRLPFSIHSHAKIRILHEEQAEILLDTFPNNELLFQINKSKYPHVQESLEYDIKSSWMVAQDIDLVVKETNALFSNEASEDDFELPLLTLLLDHIRNMDILFRDGQFICRDLEQYERFRAMLQQNKQDIYDNTKFSCSICLEHFRGKNMVLLPCDGHSLCKSCFDDYYTTMIEQGQLGNVRCPECPFQDSAIEPLTAYQTVIDLLFKPIIPFEFFDGKLSAQTCTRYRTLFKDQAFTKLEQQIGTSCLRCPRCNEWCLRKDMDDKLVHCDECSLNFCFHCLHSWHGTINPCKEKLNTIKKEYLEEYLDEETPLERKVQFEKRFGKNTIRLEADALLADRMLDAAIADNPLSLRRCPKCRTVIERMEGCNKMKCSACLTLFCFLCGEILDDSDPYLHYGSDESPCFQKLFYGMPGAA